MVSSSYPLQPTPYFKWVTLAEMECNLPLLLQGSNNSLITYILLGPIWIQIVLKLSKE